MTHHSVNLLINVSLQAASLGIAESGTDPSPVGGYRPYRGRGRSIRGYRGAMRGGQFSRASMKLDNRPKRLLVKGVSEDNSKVLHDWFNVGTSLSILGMVILTSLTRLAKWNLSYRLNPATSLFRSKHVLGQNRFVFFSKPCRFYKMTVIQGLSKGSNVPSIGMIQMSWYHGSTPVVPAPRDLRPTHSPFEVSDIAMKEDEGPRLGLPEVEVPRSPHAQDEELITSGWGEEGDGEDGMGML